MSMFKSLEGRELVISKLHIPCQRGFKSTSEAAQKSSVKPV